MRLQFYLKYITAVLMVKCLLFNNLNAQTRLLTLTELRQKPVFTSFQSAFDSQEKVYRLDISHQNLSSLNSQITQLKDIQELNITGNLFQELPPEILALPHLQILHANHNQIYRITESIVLLQNLEELYLIGNPILEVNYQIQNLPRLRKLELSQNLTFELYHSDNSFQNLTLLSVVNESLSKLSIPEASAESNITRNLSEKIITHPSRKYAKSSKSSEPNTRKPSKKTNQINHKHLEKISNLQKDKDHLEKKVDLLAENLNQSQSKHERLKFEKDSVLQAKRAILQEKKTLEAEIQNKNLFSKVLLWGSILLIVSLLSAFGYYIYRIRNDFGSLKAKLDEQEEELEDNEDIIRQQAHIISEQTQILKDLESEDDKQGMSY